MARTYVILVNWNGHADTIECLESLLRSEERDVAVVVVDNGSSDGSVAAIRAWADGAPFAVPEGPVWAALPPDRARDPDLRIVAGGEAPVPDGSWLTVIEAGENLGFAGANNLGMAFAARDAGMRYLWVLNNDTVVRPDALSRLVAHADAHAGQGIVGATLLYYHRPDIVQGLGGWARPSRALAGHIGFGLAADHLPDAAEIEARLAYVMGASMFVRRETYEATGGMSEAYFLYFEEIDWAKRLPAGVSQGVCTAAIVYHKEGGTIGTSSVARPSDTSLYYQSVNTLRFFARHERRHLPVAAARLVYNMLRSARERDWKAVTVGARALADWSIGRRRRGVYGGAEFRGRRA